MVLIRSDMLDCLPTPLSGKSSCEIPFAIMLDFHKIRVMHSHLISRLPGAYEMHYVISTQFISHMQIYHHAYIYITKAHKTCYAHSSSISSKISSHGLINKHEQFHLNYSTKHIISQKYFMNTIHVNSETLELLFTANNPIIGSLCEPEFHGHFRPHTNQHMIYRTKQNPSSLNSPCTVTDCPKRALKISTILSQVLGPIKRPFKASNQSKHPQNT